MASDTERLVLELAEPFDEVVAMQRLAEQVPEGVRLRSVARLEPGQRCQPRSLTYRIDLPPPECPAIRVRAEAALATSPLLVLRTEHKTGRVREHDVRPFVDGLEVGDGWLRMRLRVLDGVAARPAEVLTALGLEAREMHHRIRRLEIEWQ